MSREFSKKISLKQTTLNFLMDAHSRKKYIVFDTKLENKFDQVI